MPPSVAVSKIALAGAWLLRWSTYLNTGDSEAVADRWLTQLQLANRRLLAAVGHPVPPGRDSVNSAAAAATAAATTAAAAVAAAVAANPVTFELHGELGHLKINISGQPMGRGLHSSAVQLNLSRI